jgi:pimeloyl-ACP methyl ester carboxylesterase
MQNPRSRISVVLKILGGVLALLAALVAGFIAATWAPERSVAERRGRWAQPPSTFVDVAGMQVHLRDEGPRADPNPIVLLHGTGSSLHAWEGWVAALREERRVISLDLPGFGLTGPSPDGVYGRERDVGFVLAVLDRLGVQRAVIGGNSLGGGIALRIALDYPTRVDRLILVDSGGYPLVSESTPIGLWLLGTPMISRLLQNTLPRFLVVQGLQDTWGDPSRITQEHIERAIELTQREGNRAALVARFAQRSRTTIAHRIPEIRVPTLIMWGGRDRLVPVATAHRFHHDIAESTLAIFDDLGHAPEEEDPARTAAAVRAFLDAR